MKPFLAIVTHVYVVSRNVFRVGFYRSPRLIIATQICGVLVALLLARHAFATTIVAIFDPSNGRLILAADSYEGLPSQQEPSAPEQHRYVCKIIDAPNCAVAMAGLTFANDTDYPFNLWEVAKQACAQSGTLSYRADRFAEAAVIATAPWLKDAKLHSPKFLAEWIGKGGIAQVIFVGVVDGHLRAEERWLIFNAKLEIQSQKKSIDSPKAPIRRILAEGEYEAVFPYMGAPENETGKMTVPKLAERLIQVEMERHKDSVGGKIAVLSISYDPISGAVSKWLEPGTCQPK